MLRMNLGGVHSRERTQIKVFLHQSDFEQATMDKRSTAKLVASIKCVLYDSIPNEEHREYSNTNKVSLIIQ